MTNKEPRILSILIHRPGKRNFGGAMNAARNLSYEIAKITDMDFLEISSKNDAVPWVNGRVYYYRKAYLNFPFSFLNRLPWLRKKYFNAFQLSETPELIKQGDYELVHIHNLHPIWSALQIAYTCKKNGIPFAIACHGIHEAYYRARLHNLTGVASLAVYFSSTLPLKYIFQNSSLVFASSPADFPILAKLSVKKKNIQVLPNGVTPEFLNEIPEEEIEGIRVKFDIPSNTPILLHVGELKHHKGVDLLLQALEGIDDSYHLIIAGPVIFEDYYVKVKNLAKKLGLDSRVSFVGTVSFSELMGLHQIADIFILPSRFDTFPLAILEAMSKHTPVISTKVGGIPYQLDNESGFLVTPGNPVELRRAIEQLLRDVNKRTKMGEAAYQRILKYFTWEMIAQKAITQYRRIITHL